MRRSSLLLAAAGTLLCAASPADVPRDVAASLRGRLVQLRSGRLAPAPPPVARYVAFYFGAGWCGPCRALMPELRARYARMRAGGAPVEIVFVSDDAGCRAMADYIASARMPWPALACRERDRLAWLARARGAALPGLLVYGPDGRLAITSWTRAGNSRPRDALDRLERLSK